MLIDLHTHTNASDGKLSPLELIQRASRFNIDLLSITDHDTTESYTTLENVDTGALKIVPGIEFSTNWRKSEIHVIGLNIRPENQSIIEGVSKQHQLRWNRAERIATKLKAAGLDNALDGALLVSGNRNLGRPHFAEFMVKSGFVKDINQAFAKYLSKGKSCFCKQEWSELPEIIEWISAAGGVAVLAHPYKYGLTRTKLLELLGDFKCYGGRGMEVITGRQTPAVTKFLSDLCEKTGLKASCGSDFHQAGQPWSELGQFSKIPDNCTPVWEDW